MNILLICASGMSTSILVSNMRKYSDQSDHIEAKASSELEKIVDGYDVVLVGPQIRHEYLKLKDICERHGVVIGLIDMPTYGKMDGRAVMEMAKELIKKQ